VKNILKTISSSSDLTEDTINALLETFNSFEDFVFLLTPDHRILFINDAGCQALNKKKEEILGQKCFKVVHNTDSPIKECPCEYILQKKKFQRTEYSYKGRHYLLVAFPVSNKKKEILFMFHLARDITKEKKAEEKLRSLLREKSVMLEEIHHRVKNNMQIIISLMRIQSRRIKNKRLRELYQAVQDRVFSMALVHEHFYRQPKLDKIDVAPYLRRLVDHLFFMNNKNEEQIMVNFDLENIYLDLNKAVPFGLLINEIISNALKHAFPEGKKGNLSIRLYLDGNKKVRLFVSDNGTGIPASVNIDRPSTMGLQLIKDLAKQLGGEIQIKSHQGTQIKVIFPLKD